jgi:predicted nucleic acid-binding protein
LNVFLATDSSPLIVLTNIEHVNVLPALFGQVLIPTQVATELQYPARSQALRDLIETAPQWLLIESPVTNHPIPNLQPGETAAINLAVERHAELLLIDEVQGRRAALARKLSITGTIGVLKIAASAQLLDLKDAFDCVRKTDFWISHRLLDERLKIHESRHKT